MIGSLGFDPETAWFAQYDTVDQTVKNPRVRWPNADGDPIVSASGIYRFIYYLVVEPTIPQGGPQWAVGPTVWTRVEADPAALPGHPAGTYVGNTPLVLRSHDEQKIQVDDHYKAVVRALIQQSTEPERWALSLEAIATMAGGGTLTEKQAATIADNTEAASLIRAAATVRDDIYSLIDSDAEWDLYDPRWPISVEQLESAMSGAGV